MITSHFRAERRRREARRPLGLVGPSDYDNQDDGKANCVSFSTALRLRIMLTSVFSVLDNDGDYEDEDVSDENCVSAQIVVK